tara:strand:+ start:271 stop:744 length:474 start_codon:yes stop_codon:yes gene_type:complete
MSNFYHELREDGFKEDYLSKRKKNQSTDSRPQLATNRGHVDLSERGENDKIIKKIRKNELEKEQNRKTIMDMPLRDILEKTSEVSSDFWSDYKTNLAEVEINRKANEPDYDHTNLSSIIGIHIVALINYMREADHVLYMGILFVIISIILYVFNIII